MFAVFIAKVAVRIALLSLLLYFPIHLFESFSQCVLSFQVSDALAYDFYKTDTEIY